MKSKCASESHCEPKQELLPPTHYEPRPLEQNIDTIVIHSMHNPMCTEEPYSLAACKRCLSELELSAHYLIGLKGEVWQLVPETHKAWHAGESTLPHDGRTGVNAFSIGIELVGAESLPPTAEQYDSLISLCTQIIRRHPISAIYGHLHIAPQRKSDPWNFDWPRFSDLLEQVLPGHKIILP